MSWFALGLRELGLTRKEYDKLPTEQKAEVDAFLEALGHK